MTRSRIELNEETYSIIKHQSSDFHSYNQKAYSTLLLTELAYSILRIRENILRQNFARHTRRALRETNLTVLVFYTSSTNLECVRVCVCKRERLRETEREGVCACMYLRV